MVSEFFGKILIFVKTKIYTSLIFIRLESLAKMTKVMHVVNPKGKQTTLTEIYGRRKDSTSQILFPGGVDVIGECDRPQNSDYNPLDMSVHQPQLLPVLKKNQKSVLYLPHEGEVELQPANCIGYAKLVESITYTDIVVNFESKRKI